MNNTKTQLIEIIGDYINDRKTNIDNFDDELANYANMHQLGPIVYYQTKLSSLYSIYYQSVSIYINRNKIIEDLFNIFDSKGISAFVIKGCEVAKHYLLPELRIFGDVDIVVSNLEEAHKVMLEYGFTCLTKFIGREWQYEKSGLKFEIHDRLVFEEVINADIITSFLNNYHPYVKDNKLDINFHLIYIIAHLRKHLMNAGVGFRSFLDIAMIYKNNKELDWDWINNKLEDIGLLTFTQTIFAFIERWWNISSPYKEVTISDEFYENATNYIFENSFFGINNSNNDKTLAINEAIKTNKKNNAINVIFPSYKNMCSCDTYAFLRNKPFLLPFAWIYRIVLGVYKGNLIIKAKSVSDRFVSEKQIENRKDFYKQWGL